MPAGYEPMYFDHMTGTWKYSNNYTEYGNHVPRITYPSPYWQVDFVSPCPYPTGFEIDDVCPFCGRSDTYERYTELDNVIALVEPAHHKEDAWTFTYSLDDYYTLVEENEHSCSITFVKKPSCWLKYPAEPYECKDDCRLRIPCRDGTVERVHIQEYEYDIEREVDEDGEDEDYDETKEDYYRESLDRRRKRHNYST